MERPILIVAISYILGIIIGVYFKKGIPLIVLVMVTIIIFLIFYIKKNGNTFKHREQNYNINKKISKKINKVANKITYKTANKKINRQTNKIIDGKINKKVREDIDIFKSKDKNGKTTNIIDKENINRANICIKIILIILITIIISATKTINLNNKYNFLYLKYNNEEIAVIGTVCSEIKITDYKYIVTINVNIVGKQKDDLIKLNKKQNKKSILKNNKYKNIKQDRNLYNNTKLIISVNKNEKEIYKLNYGNKILLTGIYEEPEQSRNYKSFSYKEYLKTKEIYGTIKIENLKDIYVIKKQNLDFINLQINKLSNKLNNNLEKLLPEDSANLAKGIILGNSSYINDEIKENFKECNLSHMLAVSGTHLSYLILGINIILNKNTIGKKNSKIVSILIIVLFMIITNMSPSVTRAGISAIIAIVAILLNRKPDKYNTISIAALFTLIQNPFSIFNIGMQLSYLGTISIILFNKQVLEYLDIKIFKCLRRQNIIKLYNLQNMKFKNLSNKKYKLINIKQNHKDTAKTGKNLASKIRDYILQSISITLSANILIFPLIIYNFNNIPLNFILSNLLSGPILGICIILGLLTLLISIISINLAKIMAIPLNLFLKLLNKITYLISKTPMSNITIITPYILTIILIYIIIIIIYIKVKYKTHIKRKLLNKIIKAIVILIIMIVLITSILDMIQTKNKLKIYFIDVGQGDGTLICTPNGKSILIDGGGNRTPDKYDIGEKLLIPYLLDRRIKKLDYVIFSHFDADHVSGGMKVMQEIKVKNAIIGKQFESCENYKQFLKIAEENKIKVYEVEAGQKIQIENDLYFDILWPDSRKMISDNAINNNSLVCKLIYKKFSILFTGDIEEIAEKDILITYKNNMKILDSTILKVAHHRIEIFINR